MKFNVRILSYGAVLLLVCYLGNALIGMSHELPKVNEDEPEKLLKRNRLPKFDNEAYNRRLRSAAINNQEINNILDDLIERGIC